MSKSIMVVDDEEDIRSTVKSILEKEGYEVTSASNADDCLRKVEGGASPDLILMDIMMPGSTVREIVPKLGGVKVLYFSSVRMSDSEKNDLKKTGNVVGFMEKPFDVNNFIEKIKVLVK